MEGLDSNNPPAPAPATSSDLLHLGNEVCKQLLSTILWNDFEPAHLIDSRKLQNVDDLIKFRDFGGDCTTLVLHLKRELQKFGLDPQVVQCTDPKGQDHVALLVKFVSTGSKTHEWKDYPDKCLMFWDPGLHHPYGQIIYEPGSDGCQRSNESQVYTSKNLYIARLSVSRDALMVFSRANGDATTFKKSTYNITNPLTDSQLFALMKKGPLKKTGKIDTPNHTINITNNGIILVSLEATRRVSQDGFLLFLQSEACQLEPAYKAYLIELLNNLK